MKLNDKDAKVQVLRDSLEHKATGTLRIRALDMKRFLRWMADNGKDANKIVEEDCYEHCVDLRDCGSRWRHLPQHAASRKQSPL
eukprot:1555367-Amphidinium_carterae.1